MKSEWKIVKFSDIVEITSSKRIFRSDYLQDGIPFYRSKEVIEKSKGNSISTELFISEKKFEEIRNRYGAPEEGDILLTSVGTLGTSYIVKNNERFYFKDGNLTWFRSFSQDANNKFIFYWLQSNHAKHIFDTITIGSTQKALTISALKSISFKLPPIQEQQKIASILSSLDDKIELNTAMNQTLEALAQTIFKSWFVDFEPFKEGEFIESELGMIPEGWEVKSISDEVETLGGGTPSTSNIDYWENGATNWFSPTDLTKGNSVFYHQSSKKINTLGLANSSAKLFPAYSLMMTSRATIGEIGINVEESCTNQGFITLIPTKKLPLEYLYFWLIAQLPEVHSLASGSTFKEISKSNFRKFKVILPKEFAMEKFITTVKPIFEQIQQNQQQTQILTALRDTLLPKLMSGEVRV